MTSARSDLMALAGRLSGHLGPFAFLTEGEKKLAIEALRLAASQPDRSDPSPGPGVSLSAPVGEPVAWLVKWFSANGDSGIKAHTDEQNAKRAAENIERYRSSNSTAVVIPLYTHPPAPAVGPDVREAFFDLIEAIESEIDIDAASVAFGVRLSRAKRELSALTRPSGGGK